MEENWMRRKVMRERRGETGERKTGKKRKGGQGTGGQGRGGGERPREGRESSLKNRDPWKEIWRIPSRVWVEKERGDSSVIQKKA